MPLVAVGGVETEALIVHVRTERMDRVFALAELVVAEPYGPLVVPTFHVTSEHTCHVASTSVEGLLCRAVGAELCPVGHSPVDGLPPVTPRGPSPRRSPEGKVDVGGIVLRPLDFQAITADGDNPLVCGILVQPLVHERKEARRADKVVFEDDGTFMLGEHSTHTSNDSLAQPLVSFSGYGLAASGVAEARFAGKVNHGRYAVAFVLVFTAVYKNVEWRCPELGVLFERIDQPDQLVRTVIRKNDNGSPHGVRMV